MTLYFKNKKIGNLKTNKQTIESKSTNKAIYYVDLDEWGIHDGFLEDREYLYDDNGDPIPKYTNEEWKIAYDNKYGIINALQYAKDNSYGTVVFPKCNIFICYEEKKSSVGAYYEYLKYPIIVPSETILDLNNSTIKVIYDSHVANPYDMSEHNDSNPVYKLPGVVFSFSQSYNSCIKNGTLIGDKYERAFDDSNSGFASEKGCEFTTGVQIEKGSSYVTIENMLIKGFMGDAISSMTDHDNTKGVSLHDPKFISQVFIDGNGVEIEKSGSYSTDYLDISSWNTKEGIMRTNIGYTRVPNFKNPNFYITYYDENKNFLTRARERYLQNFLVHYKAKFLRITIIHEDADVALPFTRGFQITPKSGEYCTITKCELTENHRGGISNMVNHSIIEKTKIYNNGQGWLEGYPTFPDSTRYAINCEDCLPLNLIVRDCYIYNHFNGILFAGNSVTVENNIFKNMSTCLHIYNCESAIFTSNKVYNSGSGVSNTDSSVYIRNVNVIGNIYYDTNIVGGSKSSTPINYNIDNNLSRGIFNVNIDDSALVNLNNLIVHYQRLDDEYRSVSANLKNSSKVHFYMNDTFISTAKFNFSADDKCENISIIGSASLSSDAPVYSKTINGTHLERVIVYVQFDTIDEANDTKRIVINNSTLKETKIHSGEYISNKKQYLIADLENVKIESLKRVGSVFGAMYYANEYVKEYSYTFKNCNIIMDPQYTQKIIDIPNGLIEGSINFENCEITNANPEVELTMVYLDTRIDASKLSLNFKNCVIGDNVLYTNKQDVIINDDSN